jgi:hypothetical protein
MDGREPLSMKLPELRGRTAQRTRALAKVEKILPFRILQAVNILILVKIISPVRNQDRQVQEKVQPEEAYPGNDRIISAACICQNLVHKPEVPRPQQLEASMSVLERRVPLIIKGVPPAYQLGQQEQRSGRPEQILASKEIEPTDLPAGKFMARIGQPVQVDLVTFEFVGAYDTDRRMRLGHIHHAPEAIRKQPVVRLDHLAVLAARRDTRKREIVILYLRQE